MKWSLNDNNIPDRWIKYMAQGRKVQSSYIWNNQTPAMFYNMQ